MLLGTPRVSQTACMLHPLLHPHGCPIVGTRARSGGAMGTEGAVRWNLGAGSGDTVGALLTLPCQDRATRGSAAHPVGQGMKSLGWASQPAPAVPLSAGCWWQPRHSAQEEPIRDPPTPSALLQPSVHGKATPAPAKGSAMATDCGSEHPGCRGHQPSSWAMESAVEKQPESSK